MPVQKIEPTDHINLKEGSILPSIPVYNGMADNLPAEIMDREFSLTFAPNGKTKFGWKTRPGTFRLAFEAAVQHRPVKDKDDACFIQGALLAGTKQRVKENVATLDMLVYDLDTGAPIDDIITEFVERDQFAVIYSTFSHGKTQTTFPLPQFREKLKLSIDEEITDSHVRAFLRDYRKYHGSIYGPARYVGYKHLPGGVVGIAEHPPIGKYRVLIPLTAPFSILTESTHGNPQVAYQKWKRLYAGFAQALHIDGFDPACMDVSRLFYWPSCPEDPDKRGMEPFACVIVGEALDLSTVVEQDPNNPQGSNPFTEAGLNERVNSEPIETPWLLDAFRGSYRHFQAAAFFSSYYDEKNSDGGKITTECPFNHLHGDPDNVNDRGFYCQDATESRSFVAHCRHTHGADHNNLNYVDQAVKAFNIPPEDLEQFFDVLAEEGNKSESAILEDVETKGGSALIQQLIDKLTPETVGKVPSVLELIAEADVLDLVSEPWLKQIAKQTAGTLPTVRKAYRELQKTRKREADEAKAAKEGEIWIPARGDFKAIEEAALDAIKRKNDLPFLFNDHGALITLHANKTTGRLDREAVTKDRLSWLLNQVATFYQQSDNGRISTSPPA